ncbi:MAG: hypothetical protein ACKPH7_08465 [Planktothrix sp.]|uniref:hypothetical protein n=1 Tax=Planktothrix sp. TaxID=3088171 RepID=UPI0038D412C9
MSQPDPQHSSPSHPSPDSGKPLEIVSINSDESQGDHQSQEGLSSEHLNQVADKINTDFQQNKDPNWQIENNWDETKVKVNLD